MKSKMSKKLIAFILCMVLVICNSVSILADTPAPEATTTAQQTKTAGENSDTKKKTTDGTENVSAQPEDSADTKKPSDEDPAPEVKTTEEKKETTEASTEKKEDSAAADEKKDDPAEVTTKAKADTDKTDEPTTETTTGEQDETKGAEESSTKGKEETDGDSDKKDERKGTEEVVEKTVDRASTLTYENEEVKITVSAASEGAIPENAQLKVIPILKNNTETKAQYKKVEEEILTKALEDSKEIVGFLAYDITFVDQNNNELEPNGEVQVSMEYKKSVIPENLTEAKMSDTTVKVMHLEENASGQVKNVVDMTTNDQVREVQTTEKQAVEKAEFVTDSFSVFTITWIDNTRAALTAYCVDNDGSEIEIDDNGHLEKIDGETIIRNISINKEMLVNQLSTMLDSINGDEYIFSKAFIGTTWDDKQQIQRIRYNNSGNSWQYNTRYEDGIWENIKSNKLYLQYDNNRPTSVPKKDTVDSVADGIEINLYNYNKNINTGKAADEGFGFYANGYELDVNNSDKGNFTGKYTNANESPQQIHQDYLKYNLNKDGYPVLKDGEADLGYLFGDGESSGITGTYKGLNGLFRKNADGYYYYDSSENHAQLNTQQWKIDVYDAKLSPDTATFNYGNFLPFNQLPSTANQGSLYSVNGGRNATDLWFGMNINMTFYQPKEGKINNQDMIFDFRGDDDVWVFIDGVKVLDIGGIHDKKEGSINFASGVVEVEGKTKTTIATLYANAYRELHPGVSQNTVNNYLDSIFNKNTGGNYTSFKNFSPHDMKFFYLERGAGASNCKIEFNMPVLPKDSITIGKAISNYDEGAYSDVDFEFEVYTGAGDTKDKYTKVTSGNYTLVKADGTRKICPIDSSGKIILRHGEQAIINDLQQGMNYYVKETGLSSSTYDEVIIESAGIEDENHIDISDTEVESEILTVGENYVVNFQNRCAATNMKHLVIKKTLEGSLDNSQDESFTFRVTVGGGPYKGKYKIGNDYNSAVASQELMTGNGIITLQAGQVAVILGNATAENGTTGIPSGTSFKVEEIGLDQNVYQIPSYTVKDKNDNGVTVVDEVKVEDDQYEGYASGVITLNGNAQVTTTNTIAGTPDTPYIEVQKKFIGLTEAELPKNFEIQLCKNVDCTIVAATLKLSDSDVIKSEDGLTYTWKIDSLPAGTYYLREKNEEVPNHTITTVMVNGTEVGREGTIEVTTQQAQYTFTNDDVIETCSNTELISSTTNLIAGAFTNDTFFVWTADTLSVGERAAIIAQIKQQKGTFVKITENNTDFFSTTEKIEEGINYRGTVSISTDQTGSELNFTAPKQWRMVYYGTYKKTGKVNADIEVTNTYTENSIPIDLIKYGSSYNPGNEQPGATFSLYKGELNGGIIQWDENPVDDKSNIPVIANGEPELNLTSGYYKLVETKAPSGFSLLNEVIYFKVENGNVTLIDGTTGNVLGKEPDMWKVEPASGTSGSVITLKIKNNAIYDLPSAGGPGIYWYTLSGTLLMAGAALILYRQKRKREVLLRK